jgi:hypothetical protein
MLLGFPCYKTASVAQSVWQLAMGWATEDSEFESRWGKEFSRLHIIQTSCGVHPASYPMGLSPELKRPGREADRSPPTSADAKKKWIYTSTPPDAFTA